MNQEDNKTAVNDIKENASFSQPYMIIRNWDKKIESLQQIEGIDKLVRTTGLDIDTIVEVLNFDFPDDVKLDEIKDENGVKIEDLISKTINIKNQLLEYLFVIAYPTVVRPNLTSMTQFEAGGEVILITDGEADMTFSSQVLEDHIPSSSLRTERVKKGDLIIISNIPNNWTKIYGDNLKFKYFVGNPNGNHKYSEVIKKSIPIR